MAEPKYVHQDYPAMRYRHNPAAERGYDSVVVKDKAGDAELGDDWYDSPATAKEMSEMVGEVTDEPVAEPVKSKSKSKKAVTEG